MSVKGTSERGNLLGKNRVQAFAPVERQAQLKPDQFNPMITLKALSFFDDLPTLAADVRNCLLAAVESVDPTHLPVLTPHVRRADDNGHTL